MNPADIVAHITQSFAGVDHVTKDGDSFFIYNPRGDLKPNQQIPFITLITRDDYDTASNLAREGVFRLNIGVGKSTYEKHFGAPPPFPKDGGIVNTGHDFTAFNTLLPHPIYAAMAWVCIVNPAAETFETSLKPMMVEAYAEAKGRIDRPAQ